MVSNIGHEVGTIAAKLNGLDVLSCESEICDSTVPNGCSPVHT